MTMTTWPKPAEGSWTEHYPELGTGTISFQDSVSPQFYELEREAIFRRAWLNVGRVEDIPRVGSYFTKNIAITNSSVIVVRGKDGQVRAFHNICRHRGNKLVWTDFPRAETAGMCRQFTCKYHGWRYELDGSLQFVQQEGEFFDFDKADHGLAPVHCDVWAGFIFINLTKGEPQQTLREFLGPMITPLEDYPFDQLTERYDFVADNNSNWKLFADAFQEYYHVPALHPQQVPTKVRTGNGFECAHFQCEGPHRVVSTAGPRRWTLDRDHMYPLEIATRSGLVGPWHTPDLGPLPTAALNPGGVEPWGISNFQIFPNVEILIYGGWYLIYRYWPTSAGTHRFEATLAFSPARTVRERIEHEVAAVVFKEFALQDAGMLGGTQAALETGALDAFPINDQEVLVRHFHKVVGDWVADYQREQLDVHA
jgi:nitrite reductase/ring-hydroxylating ferredoxin subunit